MGRSYFLMILLVSVIFTLSISNGSGRKLLQQSIGGEEFESMGRQEVAREAIEIMDYGETGPNFNSRSALPSTPPLSPPTST
ncbi:hypothetical protein V2J09_017485 [Rumex salicifolius]